VEILFCDTGNDNVPATGERVCPAHAAEESIQLARVTRQRCGLLPNYFGHLLLVG